MVNLAPRPTPALATSDDPYLLAQQFIQSSVPAPLWQQNTQFVDQLKQRLATHPVLNHPLLTALSQGKFNREQLKIIHLEYRHAIVQIFTDSLLAAQLQTEELERRLVPGSKLYARFILGLNLMDEYGFTPGENSQGGYRGHPSQAHYLLFERVLDELGISQSQRAQYTPSSAAKALRRALESTWTDLTAVVALLAIAEAAVKFTMALRDNAAAVGLTVDSGFYKCHGYSYETETTGVDDCHEDGFWYVLTQALTPARYDEITALSEQYCNLWVAFYNAQL